MKGRYRIWGVAVVCIAVAVAAAALLLPRSAGNFEQLSYDELYDLLEKGGNGTIFCTQDMCGGCAAVVKDLRQISSELEKPIMQFEVISQEDKKLLSKYGLDRVPAVIHIAGGQVNVYKGALTKENLHRALLTENVCRERVDGFIEITIEELAEKRDKPLDFFLYFGSENCGDCKDFSAILTAYAEDHPGSGAYYVDLGAIKAAVKEEDYHLILDEYAVDWIPYILHIRNGVVVSYYEYPALEHRENTNNADPTADAAAAFFAWLENEQK